MSVCRSCLGASPKHDIFADTNGTSISQRFITCADLQISSDDGLPSNICDECLNELNIAYQFRIRCKSSDEELRLQAINAKKCHDIKEDNVEDYTMLNSKNDEDFVDVVSDGGSVEQLVSYTRKKSKKHVKKKKCKKNLNKIKTNLEKKTKSESSNRNKQIVKNENLNNLIEEEIESSDKSTDKSKKHMCTTCGKTFLMNSNLIDHERVHSGEKPYKCDICNISFSQSGHLSVHQRTHSGVKPYKCNMCERAFTVSNSLKKHLRTHTGERPYTCMICNKSFVTSYHLSNHHKRHMGEKTYKCDWPECQYGFVNFSEMKRHRNRHEKTFSPKSLNKNNLKNIHERLQSIPLIRLEELSMRFNILDREKQPMTYSELVQIKPEYLHNA